MEGRKKENEVSGERQTSGRWRARKSRTGIEGKEGGGERMGKSRLGSHSKGKEEDGGKRIVKVNRVWVMEEEEKEEEE